VELFRFNGIAQSGKVLDHFVVQVARNSPPFEFGRLNSALEQAIPGSLVVLDPPGQLDGRGQLGELQGRQ
jgi:hypothetical protein